MQREADGIWALVHVKGEQGAVNRNSVYTVQPPQCLKGGGALMAAHKPVISFAHSNRDPLRLPSATEPGMVQVAVCGDD